MSHEKLSAMEKSVSSFANMYFTQMQAFHIPFFTKTFKLFLTENGRKLLSPLSYKFLSNFLISSSVRLDLYRWSIFFNLIKKEQAFGVTTLNVLTTVFRFVFNQLRDVYRKNIYKRQELQEV